MSEAKRKDHWLGTAQFLAIGLVLGIGIWQFAQAGFDWRAVLSTTSPWTFFFAMASLPVFGFPISACYIYAGVAFSPLVASVTCVSALAVNMSASYGLTHSVFKGPILRFMAKRGWNIPALNDMNQSCFAFLMRTVPGPPFFFQNLALSLAGIPFGTYLWVSLLTQGGIALAVIFCTRHLSEDPWGTGGITVMAILGALLIARTILAVKARRRKRVAVESGQPSNGG